MDMFFFVFFFSGGEVGEGVVIKVYCVINWLFVCVAGFIVKAQSFLDDGCNDEWCGC